MFGVFALFSFLFLSSLGSAYYYNYGFDNDYHSSYSYLSSRSEGYGPYVNTRTTSYDRNTFSGWDHGDYITSTSYIKTTRESPSYGHYDRYPTYYYDDSNWYQKYWRQPNYGNRYVYDYPRSYDYSW